MSDHNAKVPLLPYLRGFDAQGGILRGTGAYIASCSGDQIYCVKSEKCNRCLKNNRDREGEFGFEDFLSFADPES